MKNEKKVVDLISSLTTLTKKNEILWSTIENYLNGEWNEKLRYYIINNNEYYDVLNYEKPYLVENKSYSITIEGGIVYLFYFRYDKGDYHILSLQNNNYSNIIELNNQNTNQESLASLLVFIENQLDDVDILIDSIISRAK